LGAAPPPFPDAGQTPLRKGVQVGVDGVGMDAQRRGDIHGAEAIGVEQHRFHPTALDWVEVLGLEQLVQATNFGATRLASGQGAGHGRTSKSGEVLGF
jgi:hypothetical protein